VRVVIVGGGFGGVKAALSLANKKNIDVKLISDQNYFEYHAALYRSATGRSPLEVTIPLKDFFEYAKNIEVIQDLITDIDSSSNSVIGESGSNYKYDKLIMAIGNVTEYYGIKGLNKFSYGIKTIHEALKLKREIHEQLINNNIERNYVVVGAGASGVELSAELASYLKRVRKKHGVNKNFRVDLIEAQSKIMSRMPSKFSEKITVRLKKLGVKLLTNKSVMSETIDTLELPNRSISTSTVVWTAGITNNKLFKKFPKIFKLGRLGRVEVDKYLCTNNNIYVIGDCASTEFSGMAQTAIYDASFVCKNLIRLSKHRPQIEYKAKKPIYAIPVGPRWATILWGNTVIDGRAGWVLRRLADLRLYLTFLPNSKALTVWRYGFVDQEVCEICKK
jgi:NADH dehydrogenase